MNKNAYVYIMTNTSGSVIYTGVTSSLINRVYEHKNKITGGFTAKYDINKLVYYEVFEDITAAIEREKKIKGGSRQKKLDLIRARNSDFKDLYDEIV